MSDRMNQHGSLERYISYNKRSTPDSKYHEENAALGSNERKA